LVLFFGPRVALVVIALFSNYIGRAFSSGLLLPLLGWLFLPWTTLAYAWAINSRGQVVGFQAIVVVIAVLVDLGVIGGGAARRRSGSH
jgi:hypothetical protein